MTDINGKELQNGSVIDIHQTVNGQNLFVIFGLDPLDVRYHHDVKRAYEYDTVDLLAPCRFTGETEFEIVGHITDEAFGNKHTPK